MTDDVKALEKQARPLPKSGAQERRSEVGFESKELRVQTIATNYVVDQDGTNIYLKGAHVENSKKPPIIILHDFGEHSGIYREQIKYFSDQGHSSYSFDMRGHGRSGRTLGHIPSLAVVKDDLLQIAAYIKYKENGRSPILICAGLSAIVGLEFHSKNRKYSKGLILCSPTLELKTIFPSWKKNLVRKIADIWPSFRLPAALTPSFVDLKIIQKNLEETTKIQLHFTRFSSTLVNETMRAIKSSRNHLTARPLSIKCIYPKNSKIAVFSWVSECNNNSSFVELESGEHSGDNTLYFFEDDFKQKILRQIEEISASHNETL